MACGRTILKTVLRVLLVATAVAPLWSLAASAGTIKVQLQTSASDGYARLEFDMSGYDDASMSVGGNVMIISFRQPVDIVVDQLPGLLPDYVGAARRDPDGRAVRIALARKVTAHATPAGDKYFVDLLPEGWQGLPPGLPQDVIENLARRAREADMLERKQARQPKKLAPVRVHVSSQPTFTRYLFAVPEQVQVSSDRAKDRLTLTFDAPIKFDLGDVQGNLPEAIGALKSEVEDDSALVRFTFAAKVDVRTFRDGQGFTVDVVTGGDAKPDVLKLLQDEPHQSAAPEVVAVPPKGRMAGAANSDGRADAKPKAEHKAEPKGGNAEVAAATTEEQPIVAPPATIAVEPSVAPQAKATAASEAAAPAAAEPERAQPGRPAAPPNRASAQAEIAKAPPPAATEMERPAREPVAPEANASQANASEADASEATTPQTRKPDAAAALRMEAPAAAPKPNAAAPDPEPPVAQSADAAPDKVVAELAKQGANLSVSFGFAGPTAAAMFHRADTLWLVFDTATEIDLAALAADPTHTLRSVKIVRMPDAAVVRIKLDRPRLSSVAADGAVWRLEIGDSVANPSRALEIGRSTASANHASVAIQIKEPHALHRIVDPEAGDTLDVITSFAPARGLLNNQDFVEFRALASRQGIVIEPLADDLTIDLGADQVIVSRPGGLVLSTSVQTVLRGGAAGGRAAMFDPELWGTDRDASYVERQAHLIASAADAPEHKRLAPRLDLARFYLARDMYPEAKGVLDVALADEHGPADDASAAVLRAIAETMMDRPEDALKDLASASVGDQHDAPLWRALAYARQGRWTDARQGFGRVEAAMPTLPIHLQRVALKDEMRTAIEVGDFTGATNQLNEFETIGVPHDMEPTMSVLIGRLAEGMSHTEDALSAYRTAANSWDRRAAAQGQLRETALRFKLGDLKRDEVIGKLETLTTVWRGDETEVEALQVLARLYAEEGRYRDSFYVMRSAMAAHPNSDMTRRIQKEAAATFDALFLSAKGDSMPVIDALALFYDFRELTPIGRRGDEMIRRLADRLVSVDLLDQAADLLQYQVDRRLQGAARAQVATRLAVIYLINHKADRALATLRASRTTDLSEELRSQRLLLEGRALSDMGRHDLALDVVSNLDGREAIRLRSDVLWAAKRWRESAEQIELMYGDRWKEWQPLNDIERSDFCAPRSATRWPRTRLASPASTGNTRPRWRRRRIAMLSMWFPSRSATVPRNFSRSRTPRRPSIRWTGFYATCRRAPGRGPGVGVSVRRIARCAGRRPAPNGRKPTRPPRPYRHAAARRRAHRAALIAFIGPMLPNAGMRD